MLTPTDIHFLVGLLTQVSRPDGVEIELGDRVLDTAAGEERDVDVTVRATDNDGCISVFEGIEVKYHTRPLDVTHVEQLCAKLADMPSITARGIVSGSGYTEPSVRKARHNSVDLYELRDWAAPMEVSGVIFSDEFQFHEQTYQGTSTPHIVFNPDFQLEDELSTLLGPATAVLDSEGKPLEGTSTLQALADSLSSHATALADSQGQGLDLAVGETRSIAFDITLEDKPYVVVGGKRIPLATARLIGSLSLVERVITPAFKVLVRHGETVPVIGCAVFEMSIGNLAGITVDPNRHVRFMNVPVADRLLKKIYRRKLT